MTPDVRRDLLAILSALGRLGRLPPPPPDVVYVTPPPGADLVTVAKEALARVAAEREAYRARLLTAVAALAGLPVERVTYLTDTYGVALAGALDFLRQRALN